MSKASCYKLIVSLIPVRSDVLLAFFLFLEELPAATDISCMQFLCNIFAERFQGLSRNNAPPGNSLDHTGSKSQLGIGC